ncbi:translation initiation factor IF-2 [Dorea sp. NSJ-36]|uniref:Translation initiation factor IF-2 n=1 Tax=Dorea hominis TaxID=2763040 RepID=A0ABR7ETM8_9FIRM|nr:translation initiation factor IF-2 [Dorea hominis]MBC5664708.1 translation initiation factor IF-2 [Dorea hominis]MCB5576578.1 translation initiation factor IF-2 [Mediterraneibacter gnavus]CCX75529.1 translation initiation factor IF-2 [Dorea sp. CAG:105]
MAKIKVYELAKELNVQSKDVLEFLESKKIEVKNHMSALEETAAGQVKEHFSKNRKSEGESGEAPKKKNIVHVFRPQNTQNGNKHGRRQGTKQTMTQGRPMQVNNGRPAKGSVKPEAPKTEERVKTAEKAKAAEVKTAEKQAVKTEIKEENKEKREEKVVKNNEKRVNNDRPNSERTTRSERGDRSGRNDNRNDRGGRNDDRRNDRNGRNDDRRNDRGGRNNDRRNDDRRNDRSGRNDDRRNDRGGRNDDRRNDRGGRNNDRRNDRSGRNNDRRNNGPSIPAPEAPTQKPQRSNKGKGKDEHKKKDYRRDEEERMPKNNKKPMQKPQPKEQKQEEEIKSIVIPEVLTIKELADKMKVVPSVIVKKLFMQGKVVTVNQEIDYDTAEEIALEFDVLCEKEEVVDVIEELLKEEEEDEKKMKKRPPVVCVMGHVDHGKTSLLDAIRHTNVIGGEAGGITQHIGAYVVDVKGEKITFLDTPGHEAFTAMRMRGASSTDIAILVVAADDGVMPQTVEAINHAKAAGVEIIVAVNKIDKPSANIERVKQEMTEYELIPEDWGGSTIFVPVSAKTGEGLEDLMEMIVLTAEVMELKANPNRRARGLVLEAQLDKGRGPVSTVLVQKGTLRVGDAIAAGSAHGKVRAMMDDKGRRVKEAGPSVPVEILGLNDVPNAGEVFVGCANDKEARNFAETFISQSKVKLLEETKSKLSLDDLFNQIQEGNLKELNIVVKADVQGSVEAIKQSLLKLSNDEVVVKIIHGGVGAVNESDVSLASASNAIIIGFNVRPDATAKETADREGVDIRLYRVIYNAIEDVEAAMKGLLDPVFEEKVLGHAEVRQLFKASGVGTIAGSYVLDGTFERDCSVRITRDGIVVFEGALASLKRFKDDVKEVRAGYECGFVFANFNDVKEGDLVEAFKMVEIPR